MAGCIVHRVDGKSSRLANLSAEQFQDLWIQCARAGALIALKDAATGELEVLFNPVHITHVARMGEE